MKDLFEHPSMGKRPKRPKAKSAAVFKPYEQGQGMLLPPHLDDLIPAGHLVRVVNETIDRLNVEPVLATYKGSGASAYHPTMLLKVLIYAYLNKIYSSRRIAKALRENVHFMWLSGMSRPDFRTLNLFRSSRLKGVIDEVFSSMALFLLDHQLIDLSEYFVDGTKLRADANRHKVVWAKSTHRYKAIAQEHIKELLAEIERVNQQEQGLYGDRDLAEQGEQTTTITSQEVKETVAKINQLIESTLAPSVADPAAETTMGSAPPTTTTVEGTGPLPRECAKAATIKHTQRCQRQIEHTFLPKLERYEQQEQILAGRNSYSRTDQDATVFRSKEDQLLPCYNLLIGTQRQFILTYNFHQKKASESDAFPAHLDRLARAFHGLLPNAIISDAGFGSEENYVLVDRYGIGNYLKYSTFHQEQKQSWIQDPYRKEHFVYDESTDTYRCPQGRPLVFVSTTTSRSSTGYSSLIRRYQSRDCTDCPVASACKKGEGPRSIQTNDLLARYRAQARDNLTSAYGLKVRKRRCTDVETPFADIKYNQEYNRCRLRGEAKMNIEIGLLSIAHNIKKIAIKKRTETIH
jgi:transposase